MSPIKLSLLATLLISTPLVAAGKHFWSFCVVTFSPCLEGAECVTDDSVWAYTPTDNYFDFQRSSVDYDSEGSDSGNAFRPVDTDNSCKGSHASLVGSEVCVKLRDNRLFIPYDNTPLGNCREVEYFQGPNVINVGGIEHPSCTVRLECN
jgi:hypothetical protein